MEIKLIERDKIDDKRWNGCVHFAINAVPYAYTWYLDNVCEFWMGLVVGNYKMVMPLVFNKKFGFEYVFQPFFAQQLGVFSDNVVTEEQINLFLNHVPDRFRYIDMNLNGNNEAPKGFEIEKRDNYLLHLDRPHEEIRKKYSGNLLRKLKKAEKNNLVYSTQLKPEKFVDFYMQHTAPKVANLEDKHQHTMLRIIYKSMFYSMGSPVAVLHENEMVAANFLIHHPQRSINLLPTSSEKGNEMGAMAFLMDSVIKFGAKQKRYLDFEGSMIPGVAKFYQSFGADLTHYYRIKRNNLPWFARILKK